MKWLFEISKIQFVILSWMFKMSGRIIYVINQDDPENYGSLFIHI